MLIIGDFLNQYSLYAEAKEIDVLQSNVYRQMEEYNSSPGVVHVDLVLFKEALHHICRIARVISQPRGHVLLVGLGWNCFIMHISLIYKMYIYLEL